MSSEVPAPGAAAPQVNASNPTTAAAAVSTQQGAITTSTSINSLEDLKRRSPALYESMMRGIGMSICNRMKDNQENLKRIMREYRNS